MFAQHRLCVMRLSGHCNNCWLLYGYGLLFSGKYFYNVFLLYRWILKGGKQFLYTKIPAPVPPKFPVPFGLMALYCFSCLKIKITFWYHGNQYPFCVPLFGTTNMYQPHYILRGIKTGNRRVKTRDSCFCIHYLLNSIYPNLCIKLWVYFYRCLRY
jgi:hypothetical protein